MYLCVVVGTLREKKPTSFWFKDDMKTSRTVTRNTDDKDSKNEEEHTHTPSSHTAIFNGK